MRKLIRFILLILIFLILMFLFFKIKTFSFKDYSIDSKTIGKLEHYHTIKDLKGYLFLGHVLNFNKESFSNMISYDTCLENIQEKYEHINFEKRYEKIRKGIQICLGKIFIGYYHNIDDFNSKKQYLKNLQTTTENLTTLKGYFLSSQYTPRITNGLTIKEFFNSFNIGNYTINDIYFLNTNGEVKNLEGIKNKENELSLIFIPKQEIKNEGFDEKLFYYGLDGKSIFVDGKELNIFELNPEFKGFNFKVGCFLLYGFENEEKTREFLRLYTPNGKFFSSENGNFGILYEIDFLS